MKRITAKSNRFLAVLLAVAVLVTSGSLLEIATLADDIVYTGTVTLSDYTEISADNGESNLALADGFIPGPGDTGSVIKSNGTMVSGALVYAFSAALKDVKFTTAYSDNEGFLGQVRFYGSADGQEWTQLTTQRTVGGNYWKDGNGHSHVYDTVTLEEAANTRYLKVAIHKGVLEAPGIREIKYTVYDGTQTDPETEDPAVSGAEMAASYEFSVAAADVDSKTTEVAGAEYKDAAAASSGQIAGYYAFYNSENQWQPGEVVFKSDDIITDYRISAFSGNAENFGMLTFSASNDGKNWKEITPAKQTYDTRGGWADMAGNYFYGTFKESAAIRFVRIQYVKKGLWINFAPAVKSFEYNKVLKRPIEELSVTDMAVGYVYKVTATDSALVKDSEGVYTRGSDAGIGVPVNSYNFKDPNKVGPGSFVPGTIDFYSKDAISDYRFDVLIGNDGSGVPVFYGSEDGNDWVELKPKSVAKTGGEHNSQQGIVEYYYYGQMLETADVHYLRISLASAATWCPLAAGFYGLDYNVNGITPETPPETDPEEDADHTGTETTVNCMNKLDVAHPDSTDIPNGTWQNNGGYTVYIDQFHTGSGTVTWAFPEALTTVQIDGARYYGGDNGCFRYYVSKDGEKWDILDVTEIKGKEYVNPDWNSANYTSKTALNAADGYKYLRLKSVPCTFAIPVPVLTGIKYNLASTVVIEDPQVENPTMKDRYEIRKAVNRATPIQKDNFPLTNVYGVGDNLWYNVYAFWDMDAWTDETTNRKSEAWKPGIIEYYSEVPITDYRIKGIWFNGVDDKIVTYASSNGQDWIELNSSVAEVGDFSNPNWGSFTSKWLYGSFKENTDIHYIRVEMVRNIVWLPFLPGMCFMDYSTTAYNGLPVRPESYVNTSLEANYFLKDDGTITFKSGSTMTDYDLWVKPINGQKPVVSVSRNGSDWKASAAVSEKVNDDVVSLYDSLPAEDGYMYIKIDLSTAEFVKLQYNIASGGSDTTRRHYEMPPLTEDIEDLDMDTVKIPISEGKYDGINEWIDLSPTMNSDQNADFIGGKYGVVGPEGEGSILISTPNVRDFKLRGAFASGMDYIHIKAYGRKSERGEETEIPLIRVVAKGYENCGFKNYVFRPADRDSLTDAGFHYIRIEMTKEITYMDQLLDFVYFYELPTLTPMPDFKAPDSAKGEIELIDRFDAVRLTEDEGGKAVDNCYMQREERVIGVNNPTDVVVRKTYFMAESYLVYKVPALSSFDIRAYKSADCITDLLIFVSADGEDWTLVNTSQISRDIYDGYKKVAYQADRSAIGDGMNYVKIEIPDLEGSETELMLYELQLLHTAYEIPVQNDTDYEQEYTEEPEETNDTSYEETTETEEEETDSSEPTQKRRRKVTKVRKRVSGGLDWWEWLLIALGGAAVIGGLTTWIILIVKKKRKKKSANQA
ncbi:MAG: hypothetical protein IJT66_03850 [Clostridia bacterium]|nr:hypothetical protein [Clostridia bacterium]